MQKRRLCFSLYFLLCLCLISSCGKTGDSKKVVLFAGFAKDEIFRLEEASCKQAEIMVYLTNIQNQYESVYGEEIWATDLEGVTLEENVKETALAKIAQVKAMNLLAQRYKVSLAENEADSVRAAAKEYFASLNSKEVETLKVTEDIIYNLYAEYALADKVYNYIIKDINPEISDDEARTITVEHILIKTYTLDGYGQKNPFTEKAKAAAYAKAQEICEKAKNGENFDSLVSAYNEDNKGIYSFRKGEMESDFEKTAFNLGKDEISDVVETQYGYHIIKCLSTFNRQETDANKVKIVEQRKKEVFNQEYNEFVAGLRKNLNEDLWESIAFVHDPEITTSNFFDVYANYFS